MFTYLTFPCCEFCVVLKDYVEKRFFLFTGRVKIHAVPVGVDLRHVDWWPRRSMLFPPKTAVIAGAHATKGSKCGRSSQVLILL
jgi:hypothetical protein